MINYYMVTPIDISEKECRDAKLCPSGTLR